MRSHHRTVLLLSAFTAACGGAGFTTEPDTTKVGPALIATSSGSTMDLPTPTVDAGNDVDPPSATSGSMAASGQVDPSVPDTGTPAPTLEAGATSGSLPVMSGATSGSGSMSGASAGGIEWKCRHQRGTCSYLHRTASQACGNCQSGTSTRVCDNGTWSQWGACMGATPADLSGVGVGNFTITFTMTGLTDTTSQQALLNQRDTCGATNTPQANWWDVRLNDTLCPADNLYVETYHSATGEVAHCLPFSTQNEGSYLTLHRANGVLYSSVGSRAPVISHIDWASATTLSWADTTNLPANYILTPMAIGTDACQGVDSTVPLSGTISNLCVEKQ